MIRKHFNSVTEFAEEASRRDPNVWGNDSRGNYNSSKWHGTDTFEEALYLNSHGWEAGREIMFRELENMKAIAHGGDLPVWGHDVAGFLPDVPRAVIGVPDCMFSVGGFTHRAKPIIRILCNLGKDSDISGQSANWHGAAILSWVDRLEQLGFACEVVAAMQSAMQSAGYGGKSENLITVDLKQAGEVLDLDRTAFALANPAFHRRFKFGVLENIPALSDLAGSYGSSRELGEADKDGATVYIYRIGDNYTSREHALDNVSGFFKSHLEKAGITLPDGA